MALEIKTITIPRGGLHGRSFVLSHSLGRECIWAESVQETGGLSVTLEVNRLGRCRAARPCRRSGPVGPAGAGWLTLSKLGLHKPPAAAPTVKASRLGLVVKALGW